MVAFGVVDLNFVANIGSCVPAILGFRVFLPYPGSYESSIEPAQALQEDNSPGLLLLHGPVIPSEADSESEPAEGEPSVESESEPLESVEADGTNGGQGVQANPGIHLGAAGAGYPMAVPGQGAAAGQAAGGPAGGNPQQISSVKGSRAVGAGVAVGACFLVVVAVGVGVYIIRQQRRNRNMERLE
ncbi:hypothetical protein HOLleu_29520 [Holothuria leucospilota]|uniref:Uncharacterized protein n=1 Tax=Holothuria leucospilota TaxID=206669 RepID=A0A9Q1H1E3_HOLLE|nr:hypothetical protein HOLleu_29520 [Holothuria leucospilota]